MKTRTECSIQIFCAILSALLVVGGVVCVVIGTILNRYAIEGLVLIVLAIVFMTMALKYRHIEIRFRKLKMLLRR